jgi:pimeloyl-ACP methyl ester carboxylesterase
MRREMLEPQRRWFAGEYAWATVDGAGHFLHRERPDEVNRRILDWLSRAGDRADDDDGSQPVSQ